MSDKCYRIKVFIKAKTKKKAQKKHIYQVYGERNTF